MVKWMILYQKWTVGNSRKYSYHTTDRFHTLTCPCLKNFKNGLSPPPCPCNYIIINPPPVWIFFFVKPFGISSRVHKYAQFGAFTSCTGHRWSKTKEQTPWNNFSLNRKQRGPVQRTPFALGIPKSCPRHGMDIFRNRPIKKTGQEITKLQFKRHC